MNNADKPNWLECAEEHWQQAIRLAKMPGNCIQRCPWEPTMLISSAIRHELADAAICLIAHWKDRGVQ